MIVDKIFWIDVSQYHNTFTVWDVTSRRIPRIPELRTRPAGGTGVSNGDL